jgi:hypothetical protein
MNPRQSSNTSPPLGFLFFGFLRIIIALIIFAIPLYVLFDSFKAEEKEISSPNHSTSSSRPTPAVQRTTPVVRPTPLPFNQPILPAPPNGEVVKYTQSKGLAPFQIKSTPGSNYLIKIIDFNTNQPIMTVFVHGGKPFTAKVPLGKFTVKYAAGDVWYGYKYLFGPETAYNQAASSFTFSRQSDGYSGYSITLYKVRNGNLKTQTISANDF